MLTNKKTMANAISNLETSLSKKSGKEVATSASEVIKGAFETAGHDVEGFDANALLGRVESTDIRPSTVKVIGKSDYVPMKIESGSVDIESFDKLDTTKHEQIRLAAINVVTNASKVDEDGIIKLCSRAMVAANETGKRIAAAVPQLTYNIENKNGISMGGTKVPLISNLDNVEVFSSATLPYIPVLRTTGDYKNEAYLQSNVTRSITYGGEKVERSPIKSGINVDLKLLCSTQKYLNESGLAVNPMLTLSEDAALENVYFSFKDSTDLINIVQTSTIGMRNSRFSTIGSGHGKDMVLSFEGTFVIKPSELVSKNMIVFSSTVGEKVFKDNNLVITVGYNVSAKVNTDSLVFSNSATELRLISILNTSTGEVVPTTSSTYTDVAAIIALSKVDSFDFKFSLSNTNNLDNGLVIDMSEQAYEIPAVIKTPITIRKSVIGNVAPESLAGYIAAVHVTNASKLAVEVYDVINTFIEANAPKADAKGILNDAQYDGVGGEFVKPMVIKKAINAGDRSSRRSAETKDDIAKLIYDQMVGYAAKAYDDSNLDKAINTIAPGEKAKFTIAAGSHIASYLKQAQEISKHNELFDVEVNVSTKLGNSVFATFKIGDDVYEFSPIILAEAPIHVYKGIETTAAGTSDVTKFVPRRNIVVNAPIFFKFEVTGITEAYKRS